MSKNEDKRQLKCSFCGKNQEQVKRLIAGPNVYICDECVELCDEIIQEEIDECLNGWIYQLIDEWMKDVSVPSVLPTCEKGGGSKNK